MAWEVWVGGYAHNSGHEVGVREELTAVSVERVPQAALRAVSTVRGERCGSLGCAAP